MVVPTEGLAGAVVTVTSLRGGSQALDQRDDLVSAEYVELIFLAGAATHGDAAGSDPQPVRGNDRSDVVQGDGNRFRLQVHAVGLEEHALIGDDQSTALDQQPAAIHACDELALNLL